MLWPILAVPILLAIPLVASLIAPGEGVAPNSQLALRFALLYLVVEPRTEGERT